jgi:hypothetical protein
LLRTRLRANRDRGFGWRDVCPARLYRPHHAAPGQGARDGTGSYRVVEALALLIDTADGQPVSLVEPLPILGLPDVSTDVLGLGGDIAPSQVSYDPPDLAIVGSLPAGPVQFAAAYSLPPEASRLELRAALPVQELLVHVDRATVEARPGPTLRRVGD